MLCIVYASVCLFFFFKQKTAYEMRISDWSSDVCSSDLEGAARVFRPRLQSDWLVGVVGALQFDVLADRIRTEYSIPVRFEPTSLYTARWVESDDGRKLKQFADTNQASVADDHNGSPVFLARNAWHLDKAAEDFPELRFLKTKEQVQ